MGKVYADLVLAPGFYANVEQRQPFIVYAPGIKHANARARRFTGAAYAHATGIVAIPANRRIDRSLRPACATACDGEIPLLKTVLGEKTVIKRLGTLAVREQYDARGIAVEALQRLKLVDIRLVATANRSRHNRFPQRIGERERSRTIAVDDHPSRLVDSDKRVAHEQDAQRIIRHTGAHGAAPYSTSAKRQPELVPF